MIPYVLLICARRDNACIIGMPHLPGISSLEGSPFDGTCPSGTQRGASREADTEGNDQGKSRPGETKSLGKVVAPSLIVLTPIQSIAGHASPHNREDICLAQSEGAVALAQIKVRISRDSSVIAS